MPRSAASWRCSGRVAVAGALMTIALSAAVAVVHAGGAPQSQSQPQSPGQTQAEAEDPTAAFASYMGYLNSLVPVFGLVLLVLSVYCGSRGPATHETIAGPSARASHILVKTETEARRLARQHRETTAGKPDATRRRAFAELARTHSTCPSKRNGGDMGVFAQGKMLPEFERVVFHEPVGSVHTVQTKFGWHVVLITERVEDKKPKAA